MTKITSSVCFALSLPFALAACATEVVESPENQRFCETDYGIFEYGVGDVGGPCAVQTDQGIVFGVTTR